MRTAITVLGVAAGIAVVLAIRLTNASALRGFEHALDLTSGRVGLEIVGAGFGIDEHVLPQLEWLREYGSTSPVIDGDVLVQIGRGAAGTGRGDGDATVTQSRITDAERTELVRVLGVDILRDLPARDYDIGDAGQGRPRPRSAVDILALLTDPEAAVISRAFASRHGLVVGGGGRDSGELRPLRLRRTD